MKKTLFALFGFMFCATAFGADFTSCGPGYVLTSHAKVDGIPAAECQKLWCRDLELGKPMGNGNTAAGGYRTTSAPITLCDADDNCVECFGDRKWCAGETPGVWNPEYGAYTRGGGDTATYSSYQKGSCFAWRLEHATCAPGETAILQDGEWVCSTPTSVNTSASRSPAMRRTGVTRKLR